jgi:hypothetical protein
MENSKFKMQTAKQSESSVPFAFRILHFAFLGGAR